jgi:hypothetical protein
MPGTSGQRKVPNNSYKTAKRFSKGCSRKRGFKSRFFADTFAANVLKRSMRSYECEFCGEWHLTSQVIDRMRGEKADGD